MTISDATLISRSRQEPEAFAEIFDRHHERIAAYVRRRLPGDLADDVVSDTFVAAFGQRERFRPEHESALPWLYGIATNMVRGRARSEHRRLRAYAEHAGRERGVAVDAGSEARIDAKAEAELVARAIDHLKAPDRDAVLLLAWGELSYEEIGLALGIPTGTVRSRINRARRRIREELAATAADDRSMFPTSTAEELA